MNLYENIRKIRAWKGLSQQNVADELKITQRHFGRIEKGEVDITITMLHNIATALDVKPQVLLGLENTQIFNNVVHAQKDGDFIAYNATDIEVVKGLYERLLKEKDARIAELLKLK